MCLGIPAQLESVSEESDDCFRTGKILFGGISRTISLALLTEARPGDYVLVHAGVALSLISEDQAREVLAYLQDSGELQQDPLPEEDSPVA
jgi:hydrogenase expression/formation protein HypC